MGTKVNSNYEDLLTFTRASGGHALRPVSYGTELVTNGDFSSTDLSDWSSAIDSTATATSGELVVTGVSASGRQVASISTTVGQVYRLTGEARVSTGSGTALLAVSDTTGGLAERGFVTTAETTATNLQLSFVATQGTHYVTAGNGSSGTGDKIFDNISVKEVTFDESDGTLTLFEHPENVPRVEWDSAGNRLGLLVEEARTNLVTYSEDFSQWDGITSSRASIQADTVLAPNGILSADTLSDADTSTGNHNLFEYITLTTGVVYTLSFYAKAGTSDYINFYLDSSFATFQFSTETLSQSGAVNATYESVGNGWYRLTYKYTATGTSRPVSLWTGAGSSTNTSYAGDPTKTVYIFGAQVEEGSFPTSYIKSNSGSTTTRSADVASIPVADFGYNQSAGTLFVEIGNHAGATTGSQYVLSLDNDSSAERMQINRFNGNYILDVVDGGASQVSVSVGAGADNSKVAFAYAANDFAATEDGDTPVTDTSGSVPTPTQISIGTAWNLGAPLNGHIKSIKYFPRRLTNAQLVELTS